MKKITDYVLKETGETGFKSVNCIMSEYNMHSMEVVLEQDFENLFREDTTFQEIANAVYFGNYHPMAEYYALDSYGNVKSIMTEEHALQYLVDHEIIE